MTSKEDAEALKANGIIVMEVLNSMATKPTLINISRIVSKDHDIPMEDAKILVKSFLEKAMYYGFIKRVIGKYYYSSQRFEKSGLTDNESGEEYPTELFRKYTRRSSKELEEHSPAKRSRKE